MRILLVILIYILGAGQAFAQALQGQVLGGKQKFTGFMFARAVTNTSQWGSVDHQAQTQASLMINYAIDSKSSLRTIMSGNKKLHDDREADFTGGWVGYVRNKIYKNDFMSTQLQLRAIVPTSEEDRQNTSRQSGVSLALVSPISLARLGHERGGMLWIAGATRNIHRFTTSASGESNIEYQLNNFLIYSFSLSERTYFNLSGSLVNAINYNGRKLDDRYDFAQELSYAINKDLLVGIGHSNQAQLINNQVGMDQNFEIFNKKNSTYYVSLFYSF
jgi:hypothetical protein